jgi:hypothetical protein
VSHYRDIEKETARAQRSNCALFFGSSKEIVARFGLWQLAKRMIEGQFENSARI